MLEIFKNYICKEINNRKIMGSFIKTKYIDVLLTNYIDDHFINEKLEYSTIGKNEKKSINMQKDRYKYTDKDLNITMIEILKEDNISNFFEIDEDKISNILEIDNVNKAEEKYKNESIIYFGESSNGVETFEGKIKDISEKMFLNYEEDLINEKGSPLILKSNSKMIGMYVDEKKALSIKSIINKMEIMLISKRKNKNNNEINYIKCKYKKEKKIQIINNGYKGFSHDKMNELLDKIIEDENEDKWKEKYLEIKINKEIEDKFKFLIDENFYKNEFEFLEVNILLDSELEKLNYIFSDCECLQEVDFSYFNSDKITDMSYMFLNCSSLKKIIFPKNFKTENVTNMNSMFCNCSSLEEIDLTSFNTEKVTDMGCMFSGCNKLKKITAQSKTSTYKNTGISEYLLESPESKESNNEKNKNKKNGEKVLINNFMTITNEDIQLKTNTDRPLINFEKKNNENKSNKENKKSEKETNLSIFNTSKVENMSCMFAECTSLEGEINLPEFKTNNPKDMSFMFYKCEKLKKIKLSLNSNYKVNMKNMFISCKCEEYILGNPKIDKNKENIVGIFEDIKYYHFRKFKFTNIGGENKELKEIIQIKKWVYICNFILIILLILSLIVFIILI